MKDRSRELVPGSWNMVKEEPWPLDLMRKDGVLNTRLSAEDSEHSV